jgi:hypothetical protein
MNAAQSITATFTPPKLFTKVFGFNNSVSAITPAGDGSGDIYVGGDFTTYNGAGSNNIIRLNADGSADTAFVIGTGFNNGVRAIAPAGDGSGDIYVGGTFTAYNGAGSNNIIRLNADGLADTAFVIGTGFNFSVFAIAPAGDGSGDIYVGGFFIAYNGAGSNRIIRLNTDGSADTAFAIGTGFNNGVRAIVPAGDGSGDIYVGGEFTTYSTFLTDRIARLAIDGTVR